MDIEEFQDILDGKKHVEISEETKKYVNKLWNEAFKKQE